MMSMIRGTSSRAVSRVLSMCASGVALALLGGCADSSTTPPRLSPESVRLSVAVQVSNAASSLRVTVGYQRTGGGTVVLREERFSVGSEARAVPLSLDIAPCLADPLREGPAGAPAEAGVCVLRVTAAIFDENNAQVDQATSAPINVKVGDNAHAALVLGARGAFVALAPGQNHTCRAYTSTGGSLTCWGGNNLGQLARVGAASPTPVAITGLPDFIQLESGWENTCGLARNGRVTCWGFNFADVIDRMNPTVISSPATFSQMAIGSDFGCGLSSGTAYCWGINKWGALGDGTLISRPTTAAAVKGSLKFRELIAGANFACGSTDGPWYCWGTFGDSIPTTPAQIAAATAGPTKLPNSDVIRLVSLVGGYFHACGLTDAGTALCVGRNVAGELGDGTTTNSLIIPVPVSGGRLFTSLTAGLEFTCGLASDGAAYCWGRNTRGQLGDGTTTNRTTPTRVSTNVTFATIQAEHSHVCAATAAGATYCWGWNATGQLGDGTTTNRTVPTLVK
jgi:alpha-tubulin suppressor-like RCC1 family protein